VKRDPVLAVVALLVILVPASLLVWMRVSSEDRLSEIEPPPVPLEVPVGSTDVTQWTTVTVTAAWGPRILVVAPNWYGTVERIEASVGDMIESGDVVLRVNGVDRIAVATADPFWRFLRRGDAGDDVRALEEWLAAAGYYEGQADGRFGRDVETAVKHWATDIGVSSSDGTFDPGWLLWLPEPSVPVAEIDVAPASPVPAAGSVVLAGPLPLESVSLTNAQNQPLDLPGDWVLELGDGRFELSDGQIAPGSLDTIASILGAEHEAEGRVAKSTPTTALVVPSTAVMSDPSGGLCVYVASASGFEPRWIQVSGGQATTVYVSSGLEQREEVLANPADVLDSASCP
jgi:peptidoglycan hydrolase-like protein with peptidoglycan-binding domain